MIEIKDLVFSYGKDLVLENISTHLEEGRIYGLLGENGVGKTTLLTLLCGLKKAGRGSILTDGENPFDRSPSLLEKQYYLPDEVAPVAMGAAEYAKERGRFWPNYDHNLFLQIMKEFETEPGQVMSKMSAGQLKKTYISFALATGAKYLFMDEPTNGLDIPSKSQFRSAIMSHTSEDSTIVISTHQVRDLENIIDPVIILDKRDVLLNATMEEISSKLYFDYGTAFKEDALFREPLPGGLLQVMPNHDGQESKVNIEALFNAVHAHKALIKEMFNSVKEEA
ncbi:MAG: ATP-binding cassette domain-containing protein [Bacteroidales bacterium]|nr:ATP-binding cassette domain-containing protein [Bacteroidales bacterium]